MVPRLILLVSVTILLSLFVLIMTIGHDFNKGPMQTGCRRSIIMAAFSITTSIALFICGGIIPRVNWEDFDYSWYLGEDYKANYRNIKRTSTIISNHVSPLDSIVLVKTIAPAFAATSGLQKIPIVSRLVDVLDSIYIPRGGTEARK
jgi:1-acyl-sn-glycerol-3-phosphate acyltransferase